MKAFFNERKCMVRIFSLVVALSSGLLMASSSLAAGYVGSTLIYPALSGGRTCIDVAGASFNWGAKVQQWGCNGTNAQVFRFYRIRDSAHNLYMIINENSGLCLDVESASKDAGANVRQWGCNGTRAQQFWVIDSGQGQYGKRQIVNDNSNMCLDIDSWNGAWGARLQQWYCTNHGNQLFYMPDVPR